MNTAIRKLYLFIRAIPKTIYFNFKYLPLKKALKLPILVSHRVWLMNCKGKITLNCEHIQTAMIKIGFGEVGIFDQMRERAVWNVKGEIRFNGSGSLGHGCKISVEESGTLILGREFNITAESAIICRKRITIGDNVMISWENQIMDTDLHPIIDSNGSRINEDEEVEIGHNCWLGSRCIILKGARIPDGGILGAGTIVTKSSNKTMKEENHVLWAGNPIKPIKLNVTWKLK